MGLGNDKNTIDAPIIRTVEKPAGAAEPAVTLRPAVPSEPPPRPGLSDRLRQARRWSLAWSRRPVGRLTISGVLLATLVSLTAVAGAWVVPAAHPAARPTAGTVTGPSDIGGPQSGPAASPSSPADSSPGPSGVTASATPPVAAVHPLEGLAPWAAGLTAKVDIPVTALEAYGYAQLVLAQTAPACHLQWTTLAAIGKVESDHGRADNAQLRPDGFALPPIIGPALNGTGGHHKIPDSDGGAYDGDRAWDHAVGPMQFIPHTWDATATDADNDGRIDPNDINDAALAAGILLCQGGHDLSNGATWRNAILTYNDVQKYASAVFAAADEYGRRSRT